MVSAILVFASVRVANIVRYTADFKRVVAQCVKIMPLDSLQSSFFSFYGVEVNVTNMISVSNIANPALWVPHFGRFIHDPTVNQSIDVLTRMTLYWRDKLNRAM